MDEAGFVAEGPTMNLGVVTREGELVVPPFERSLAGCTVKRVMELVEEVIAVARPVLVVHLVLQEKCNACLHAI